MEDFSKARRCYWNEKLGRPVFEGDEDFMKEEYDSYVNKGTKGFEGLELKSDHGKDDRALAGKPLDATGVELKETPTIGKVEIEEVPLAGNPNFFQKVRDNRALFRKKENTGQTCRVCGSSDVHTMAYNVATMDCVTYLRNALADAEDALATAYRSHAEACERMISPEK